MRNLNTVFCHLHSQPQPRYPRFTVCPYCREDARHEAIVVEAAVNYFSTRLPDFSIQTEVEITMGSEIRRPDIVLVDSEENKAVIVECKRIGFQGNGINQLKSYLCATATPLGVFANSTEAEDWKFFQNLGRNRFEDITKDIFWECIRDTAEGEDIQPLLDAETYYNQGNAKRKLRQYAAAIEDYDNAIRLKPDDAKAYYNRGLAKRSLGGYAASIEDYDTAIRLNPDYTKAYRSRGHANGILGQHAAAIEDYDNAIRLKPDDAAYYNRGIAKKHLGQHAAIEDYDEAIRLNPDCAKAYNNRGVAKDNLGQHADAIEDYDTAIRLEPDYAKAYNNRGVAKDNLGQYAAAIEDYDTAIRLEPDYAKAYNNRGVAKDNLGQHAAAIEDYDEAIHLEPDYADAHYNRERRLD